MKIAVASCGKWLDSMVDFHTGRASFFILYDTEQENHETIDNWLSNECLHWAGSKAVDLLAEAGAEVVITRRCGPCAFRKLVGAKIAVFYVEEGTVVSSIRLFRDGWLPAAEGPNCKGHSHLG